MSHLRTGEFFGKVSARYANDGVVLSELLHVKGRKLPPHSHESAYFSLLLTGAYREQTHGTEIEQARFSTVYHPPGTAHTDEIGRDGVRFFMLEIAEQWLADAGQVVRTRQEPVVVSGPPLALRLYLDYRYRAASTLEIESIVLDLIGEASHHEAGLERGLPRWLRRSLEAMHDDPAFPHSVKSLAAVCGVHPVHLARVFRARFGCPLSDYLHGLRLQLVLRALEDPEQRIADVACEAGYSDQSHMSRVFKRWVGIPPAAFRRIIGSTSASPQLRSE